jgi:hypothetical protein
MRVPLGVFFARVGMRFPRPGEAKNISSHLAAALRRRRVLQSAIDSLYCP